MTKTRYRSCSDLHHYVDDGFVGDGFDPAIGSHDVIADLDVHGVSDCVHISAICLNHDGLQAYSLLDGDDYTNCARTHAEAPILFNGRHFAA